MCRKHKKMPTSSVIFHENKKNTAFLSLEYKKKRILEISDRRNSFAGPWT